jgi:phosphohistidine phosphatase
MNLYLMRHGIAVARDGPGRGRDSERPLNRRGKKRTWLIAQAMDDLGIVFDLIVSSPYLRARQTAGIVAEFCGKGGAVHFTKHLQPGGNMEDVIDGIRSRVPLPQDVLLVGHEPYLSGLASLLIAGKGNSVLDLKKGGLCKLSVTSLTAGKCASLQWLLTPRLMIRNR